METKYFKPRSVAWWTGVGLILLGGLVGLAEAVDLRGWEKVINAWTGNMPASVLILMGAGQIGLRGKDG